MTYIPMPKAPMGRGWADIHTVYGVTVRFGFDSVRIWQFEQKLSINDNFRKIVIVGDDIHRKEDELGVLTVGLLDFLTDKNLLEQG